MRHGNRVINPVFPNQGTFGVACRRHDAIDHGIGERAIFRNPIGQIRIAQTRQAYNGLTQNCTIALEVVTGHARERPHSAITTQFQRGNHRAKCGFWRIRMSCVIDDIRVCSVKPFGHWVNIISTFGHGQCDDTNGGIGHFSDQICVAIGDRDIVDHCAHNLGRGAFRIQFDQSGHAILGQQFFTLRRIIGAHTRANDCPIHGLARLHQTMQVPRLVGTVEIPKTDVHNPSRQRRAIIGRARD